LKIDTDRDGIDVDCCRKSASPNCSVNSPWDDAICPKSSYALGSARATENVTISGCYVTGAYELGALLDGTFKRLAAADKLTATDVSNLAPSRTAASRTSPSPTAFSRAVNGLALETVDGGLLEDISITNITMRDIVSAPIFMRLGSRMRGPAGVPVDRCAVS